MAGAFIVAEDAKESGNIKRGRASPAQSHLPVSHRACLAYPGLDHACGIFADAAAFFYRSGQRWIGWISRQTVQLDFRPGKDTRPGSGQAVAGERVPGRDLVWTDSALADRRRGRA